MRSGWLLLVVVVFAIGRCCFAEALPQPKYRWVLQISPATGVVSVRVSPDGASVATRGEVGHKLWDVRSGKMLRDLMGDLKRTQSIVFSADGRTIVAGGSYGTTNVWDVGAGRHRVTLFPIPDVESGAATDAWLAYTHDGWFDGSAGVERYLAWRVGDRLLTPATVGEELRRPDRVGAALRLEGR